MNIKIISDTHNDHDKLLTKELDCDILIHAGDFGIKGNFTETINFYYWFVKQPAKYKILVHGNHDQTAKKHKDLIKLTEDLGIYVLNNKLLEINNIKLFGVNYVPSKSKVTNEFRDNDDYRKEKWSQIPNNLDLLITHAPPQGILDSNSQNISIGCDKLLEKVLETKPKYHVFGHIHEHGGKIEEKQGIIFMNCANKDYKYKALRNTPMVIDI